MDKDASQMTDEELDQMIESGSPLEVSPSEPTTEEVVGQEEGEETTNETLDEASEENQVEETEPEQDTAQEAAPPASRRENLRIQQLLEKMKSKPAPAPQVPQGMDYRNAIDADPEVINQLETDRQTVANNSYNQGLEQAKSIQFHTRLEIDAPKVEAKHAVLNPEDREHFNPAVANAVNTWYLNMAGYDQETGTVVNPDIRYADFADGVVELAKAIAGEEVKKATKNVVKQVKQTGLRPDGSTAKRLDLNKNPGDMTDEELDAYLKQAGVPLGN
jgi:hypothetical protein